MWPEFLVLTPTVLLVSAVAVGHRPQFREARLNWRILSVSGLFLAAFGLGTIGAMGLYSGAFALAATRLARREPLAQAARVLCGGASVAIGLYLVSTHVISG